MYCLAIYFYIIQDSINYYSTPYIRSRYLDAENRKRLYILPGISINREVK